MIETKESVDLKSLPIIVGIHNRVVSDLRKNMLEPTIDLKSQDFHNRVVNDLRKKRQERTSA